jgi:hypothetical protein
LLIRRQTGGGRRETKRSDCGFTKFSPPGQRAFSHPKRGGFSIKRDTCTEWTGHLHSYCEVSAVRNVGIAAILLFGSCIVKDDNLNTLQGLNACGVDDLDTTLPSGKYVDFFLNSDSTLIMSWGSQQNGKIGAHEYGKWPVPRGLPWYICEFDDYIALRESCGSSCWSLMLLPTNPGDSIVVLEEDLLRDTNRGYIFARRCFEEESEFCLYNVNSRTHQPINLPGYEWPGDITIALDSFAFVEEGLFVRWDSHLSDGRGFGEMDTVVAIE